MASPLMSNPDMSSESRASVRRRKKKISQIPSNDSTSAAEWKSEAQQQVYSSKLLKALRQARLNSLAGTKGRAVREVADRVLAVAAKGRTRWSRAILTNRLRLKFMKKHNKRQRAVAAAAAGGHSRLPKKSRPSILRLKTKNLPTVQRKAKVLGRLVPGCRKETLPVILEEATDYIPALEMQVRVMSALFQLLSGAGGSPPPPSSSGDQS